MKRFRHPFFALLLCLLLIGSQQAAFAHLLTHVTRGSATETQLQDESGSIDHLADSCTSCIAFAGVGGGALPSVASHRVAAVADDSYLLPALLPVFTRTVINSRARAPPSTL